MVKHTLPTNCLSVFGHFVGLALKGLTEHLFKNLHVFRSFKVLCVLTFTIIKEENDSSLQEYGITTRKDKILLIFKNSSIAAGYPSLP